MSQSAATPQPTLFRPGKGMGHLNRQFDNIPKTLFRVYSTESCRSMSQTYPTSATSYDAQRAAGKPQSTDILQITDMDDARTKLGNHLHWRPSGSNFVSWTSSFMFAIQLALYKSVQTHHNWPAEVPHGIQIYILDTRKLPYGSLIPAIALVDEYGVKFEDHLKREDVYGEYLSQGYMDLSDSPMTMFTLGDLIENGLFELYPHLNDHEAKHKLASRVSRVRRRFDETQRNHKKHVPSSADLETVHKIVTECCLHLATRPILVAALLSLNPRKRKDESILDALRGWRWGKCFFDPFDTYLLTHNR